MSGGTWGGAQAAAHGVPTVATRNGGPVDIMRTLHHGVVVDPNDETAVAEALLHILTDRTTWETMSKNGAHFARERLLCLLPPD